MTEFVADTEADCNEFAAVFEPDSLEREYYVNVRKFRGGKIEAVMRAVRPMQLEAAKQRWEEFGAGGARRSSSGEEIAEYEKQANHRRSVRRAKQTIRFLIKHMCMDRMLTLTYRENVEDRERVKQDFIKFIRLVRKHLPGWSYVAVLEKQERGAYHVHIAIKGWQCIKLLRACWHEALGVKGSIEANRKRGEVLAKGEAAPGGIHIGRPEEGRRQWQVGRLAGYLTKYLAKTFDETSAEKKRYWQSKDCDQPVPVRRWVAGAGPLEAIRNCVAILKRDFALEAGANMWMSRDCSTFWVGGVFDPDPLAVCPF